MRLNKLTYSKAGVDYSAMDPVKISAQKAAALTANNLHAFDAEEITESRGESAYVWEEKDAFRSLVIEGLGTKNLIADLMRDITGKTYYDQIAQDAIAMIVNDLIVVGALPQVINAYFAVGDSNWMKDTERANDLIRGWAAACDATGATWGGGETPTLKNVIEPATIDIGGSAIGIINPKKRIVLGDKLSDNDVIVLIESSGIHANGITFIRSLAGKNPDIYTTKLPDGRLFGEVLLTPTHLYVNLVRTIMEADIDIHYMVNVTGHGWRKLMRATKEFTYEINTVPPVQQEFSFIQKRADATDKEMYGNFNMGAGFAIYLSPSDAKKVISIAQKLGLKSWITGTVKKGPKKVIIKPKDITFEGETLGVRA